MPNPNAGLSEEARQALRRESRITYLRSMLIAFGFAAIPSFVLAPIFRFNPLITWVCFGIPMGLAMPALHLHLLDHLRHRSVLVTILRQSAVYAVTIYVAITLSLLLAIFLSPGNSLSGDPLKNWVEIITYPFFLAGIISALLMVVPIRFLFALSQKLGPGVLGKWMRGYYHVPREEKRIFMFLDMKDSTTLAERLGNMEFSALVRDFFVDLTLPVLQTKAEVSHYIGDEAVLTWTMPNGLDRANCIRIFFEFHKALQRRSDYYLKRYGFVPEFKAGAHHGAVVATEVGEIKSEIVYHGDVLNTAARIQGMCGSTGESLLISQDLRTLLEIPPEYEVHDLGEFELKGKEATLPLAAVRASAKP